MKRNDAYLDRLTNKCLIRLEIRNFYGETYENSKTGYYFLTLVQDKNVSSLHNHDLYSDFESIFGWMKSRINASTHGDRRNISAFSVIEDDIDDPHVRKHLHVVIAVPDHLLKRFHSITDGWMNGLSTKASKRWRSKHPRGSFHIQQLIKKRDFYKAMKYSFKACVKWRNRASFGEHPPYRIKLSPQRQPLWNSIQREGEKQADQDLSSHSASSRNTKHSAFVGKNRKSRGLDQRNDWQGSRSASPNHIIN